ncbi:Ig-like domain-containing protein [Blautia sp. NSJ-166]|uniref:Ig-like domain-containing protein n=1 Tax=Blautia sp. NSJ-166 TaxID=2931882 RepID=UPI0015B55BEA|nr:Ig-like domain-containing protein [Blautia sp. NSJ-166]MCJ8045098.1 Ig-like domain-containing protein [Blautia sp. NSJ-166]
MLRKELQKKMQAVAMAAVVTLTTVGAPATTFAGELPGELTAEAFSDNGEAVTEEVTEDDFSDGETAAGQSSAGENEVVDVPAAQAEESSEGSTEDEQAKAQAYLKENFIDGSNKIITSGGTGVTKSEDGLTYNVALTIPTSGYAIRSMRLKYVNTVYKTGWYIDKDNPYVGYKAPATNGSRSITRPTAEQGPYTFTATLKLFALDTDTTAINDGTATALATQDFTIVLAPEKKNYTVNIKPVNAKTGEAIEGATVDIQKDWSSLTPADDGSYTLVEGSEYTLTVTADGYDKYTQTILPSASGDIEVKLSPIVYRNTTFAVTGNDGATITDADITVKEGWYTTLRPQEDGSYKLQAGKEYKYTITKDGYKEASGSFTVPDEAGDYTFPVTLQSNIDPADQAAVDAVKKAFDAEFGTLRPVYGTDSNIADMVLAKVKKYNLDVDVSNVKVSLATSEDTDYIGTDGTIHYVKSDLNSMGVYSKSLDCTFKFTCNNASAVSENRRVTVSWDQEYFRGKMQAEADQLTWDSIKGNNASQEEVTSDLTLPGCMGTSMRNIWSTVTWESSDPDVISIQNPSIDSPIYPRTGKINPKTEDTEVTLTATFKANDILLNEYIEKADSFGTITKTFKVTVKGSGSQAPTEEELKAILDKYYTADQLKDFTTQTQLDTANCTGDIQLPRYTRIKDENGEYVFNNKEITVTSSDANLMKINGYRAAVDLFTYDKDTTANLIVTFTREGVTATKEIPITVSVKDINEKLDAEIAMMDYAKAHYFDGIKGDNADADSITTNLHAFQEMYLDNEGKAVWVYNADDKTGAGIITDDYFDDPWIMEGQGYNHFKSSNNAVIQHENLVVNRPESNTQITISSLLSSEKYGQFAKDHLDNAKLQKLYKQEASVTVTVKGTKAEGEALKAKIQEANTLLESITEGTEAGQYPEGTKDALSEAIKAAQAVSDNAEATEAQQTEAITALAKAMKDCQDSRIPQSADVTVIAGTEANTAGKTQALTVKATDAALYGYVKPEKVQAEVTVLDALADLHAAMYGDAFKAAPEDYLVVNESGLISKAFGVTTANISFFVNNKMPLGDSGYGSMCNEAVLNSGDVLNVFFYNDTAGYSDEYLYFDSIACDIMAKKDFILNVKGFKAAWGEEASAQKDITVELRDSEGKTVATGTTDENGNVTLNAPAEGTYTAAIVKTPYEYYIPVDAKVVAKAHEHSYTTWKKVSSATVFAPEKQESTCDFCGEKTTKTVGEKLTPTVKLTATKLALKTKQSVTVRATGLAKGDYVKSWTSSKKSVATVDKNGKITATSKEGTAVITVTLASKKTAKVTVTVKMIRTTKLTKVPKTLSLTTGKKYTLKPVVTPSNSQEKVTYKSSNTKIATVSSTGVITAKKVGKVTITVQSGKQKATVTLTVKKAPALKVIKNVPTKKTITKGKTYTLKPQLYPSGAIAKITYTTSNKSIATVDSKGKITAKKKGTAVITVKAGKFTAKCKVTVK